MGDNDPRVYFAAERTLLANARATHPDPAIRPLITALDERHGFETDVGHLTVFGRCQECRSR